MNLDRGDRGLCLRTTPRARSVLPSLNKPVGAGSLLRTTHREATRPSNKQLATGLAAVASLVVPGRFSIRAIPGQIRSTRARAHDRKRRAFTLRWRSRAWIFSLWAATAASTAARRRSSSESPRPEAETEALSADSKSSV